MWSSEKKGWVEKVRFFFFYKNFLLLLPTTMLLDQKYLLAITKELVGRKWAHRLSRRVNH